MPHYRYVRSKRTGNTIKINSQFYNQGDRLFGNVLETNSDQCLNDVQKVILRLYAKNEKISIRNIKKVIIKPNKTMIGRMVVQFEKDGFIKRIGKGRNMSVFITDKGRKEVMK